MSTDGHGIEDRSEMEFGEAIRSSIGEHELDISKENQRHEVQQSIGIYQENIRE